MEANNKTKAEEEINAFDVAIDRFKSTVEAVVDNDPINGEAGKPTSYTVALDVEKQQERRQETSEDESSVNPFVRSIDFTIAGGTGTAENPMQPMYQIRFNQTGGYLDGIENQMGQTGIGIDVCFDDDPANGPHVIITLPGSGEDTFTVKDVVAAANNLNAICDDVGRLMETYYLPEEV